MSYYQGGVKEKVRLNDVCNVLCEMLYESDYNDVQTVTYSFDTIENFLEEFCKRINGFQTRWKKWKERKTF